jgi:hypothetical protein
MKKYNNDYFQKKYKILFDKLAQKQGFIDDIKKIRIELGLPVNGFDTTLELSIFFIKKINKSQQQSLTFFNFIGKYENEAKIPISEADMEEVTRLFLKKKIKEGVDITAITTDFVDAIEDHNNLFTKSYLFETSKYLSELYSVVFGLMQKYWSVDLFEDNLMIHFIEKYLFLGQAGINMYVKSRISCPSCKYIGIKNFSPRRGNMQGKDKGPYSKGYLFNKETVQMLSADFNSTFLIIKPYATKELVLQYVEDNWDSIKNQLLEKNTFYKQYNVNPSVIKESDGEKNRLVYELNKLSKKELLKKYKGKKDLSGKGVYKEAIVSTILKEEYGIEMSSDAVKKSASRFAKSTAIQKTPKDIRDI